jgi:hypothetical protein
MNNIRAKFEEIWPVPEGIEWVAECGLYFPINWQYEQYGGTATSMNARLDTFTRCQETTALYARIVDELIAEMEFVRKFSNDTGVIGIAVESIGRAKQKLEQIK